MNKNHDTLDILAVTDKSGKLFKLVSTSNALHGAPGRLLTAYGLLASAHNQWVAAVNAENAACWSLSQKAVSIVHVKPVH